MQEVNKSQQCFPLVPKKLIVFKGMENILEELSKLMKEFNEILNKWEGLPSRQKINDDIDLILRTLFPNQEVH